MRVKQADSEQDWIQASEILTRVVHRLDAMGKSLWTAEQTSVPGLQKSYQLSELHFIELNSQLGGIAFLQQSDPFFWPEIAEKNSLYVHKFALEPSLSGQGLGTLALAAIVNKARCDGFTWIRLDCDDRPELHHFYQTCGFELVDFKQIEIYRVARYQLQMNTLSQG